MQAQQLIRELPKGLIRWYEFNRDAHALVVTGGTTVFDMLPEALEECGLHVTVMPLEEAEALRENSQSKFFDMPSERYRYIVMVGALEYSKNPTVLLQNLHRMLSADGRLLLGTDNRLGIRYFCGDRDVFTDRNFDSIENYFRINAADRKKLAGRAYSRAEIDGFLQQAGFDCRRFYSVMPELSAPQLIFSEDYRPKEELEVRCFPSYNNPETVFLEEERLYTTLIQNGLFHTLANAYFIECSMDGGLADVEQVTISMDRGREHALATIIKRDDTVVKKAIYPEGRDKLVQLTENDADLRNHGIPVVPSELQEDANGTSYVMPFVHGEVVTHYFRRMLREDQAAFLQELDHFYNLILSSSEHVSYDDVDWDKFDPDWERRKADDPNRDKWRNIAFGSHPEKIGVILKKGYIDLVSLNCFRTEHGFLFYDQEFYIENLPAKAILQRSIDFIYRGSSELEMVLPQKDLQERYGLNEHLNTWRQFSGKFLQELRNEKALCSYHQQHRRDLGIVNSNRQRMNYSENRYQKLFRDIFRNTEGRKLYLFGSGNFTKKFLSQFGNDYQITGILDNNKEKWGGMMEGIPISSPDVLKELRPAEYKVIICIKNYVPVVKQLQEMGVKHYGIYDRSLEYPRKMKPVATAESIAEGTSKQPKKYHTGYIAGVFDLFHIGHLNMFRRAKEQCEYLIVGVVTDESVMKNKKTLPYVPFEERIEMVRACRYVDEAVEIPTEFGDTDEAYRRYQFDVQFSGSDYAEDPGWLAKKAYLEQRGAELVFFPYTQSTSSTKLKEAISGKSPLRKEKG